MHEEEARRIAVEAARAAVRETLEMLGIDVNNPREAQLDSQFLRKWRTSADAVKRQGLAAAVWFIVTAMIGYIAIVLFKGH